MRRTLRRHAAGLGGVLLVGALALALLPDAAISHGTAPAAPAPVAPFSVTPFSQDVTDAIDAGLQYLRNVSAFTSTSSTWRSVRGLNLLALLEKRESADFNAAIVGYNNSLPADQVLAQEAVSRIMTDTSWGVSRGGFYAYSDGENLMALSLYARTGGPEIGGAPFTLRAAIDRIVDRTIAAQTKSSTFNGFWGYTTGGDDSSTTQFCVAGLAAAKGYYLQEGDPGARIAQIDAALARTRDGYAARQNPDGGEGYRVNSYPSSYQQTASALWASLLGGAGLNGASTQDFLAWQRNAYNYQTIYAAYNSWPQSYYYYFWSSSKAYTLIEDSGEVPAAGNVTSTDLGTLPNAAIFLDRGDFRLAHRDPTTDFDARVAFVGAGQSPGKYFEEQPRWYYDYAYTLMTQQNADGRFNFQQVRNNGTTNFGAFSWGAPEQAYAILVLERALGGACLDTDGDGICDEDDNCPSAANPGQEDADGDGVGDACEQCPGQDDNADDNNNGIPDCTENQPPQALCIADVTLQADASCSANVNIDAGSFDPDGDPLTITQAPPGPYALGVTPVMLTVDDLIHAPAMCMTNVTVVDAAPPVINSLTATPNSMWPPNHNMTDVTVTVDLADNCGATCSIVSVASNEPENGTGDGDTAPDWNITGALTVELRAERAATGSGRVYTITVECVDAAGNATQSTVNVTVPLSVGGGRGGGRGGN